MAIATSLTFLLNSCGKEVPQKKISPVAELSKQAVYELPILSLNENTELRDILTLQYGNNPKNPIFMQIAIIPKDSLNSKSSKSLIFQDGAKTGLYISKEDDNHVMIEFEKGNQYSFWAGREGTAGGPYPPNGLPDLKEFVFEQS